jgi:DNA-binding transcriptional LysR family regulator
MSISLDALETIDLIARLGSFAAAARALGRVPSALSYQIRQLEESLDVLIFDRRGRRSELTAAGQALLAGGRELLRQAEDLRRETQRVASGWEPELCIALDATIPFERLIPLIADFDRLKAPTQLRISEEVLQGSWDALIGGRADLAIGAPFEAPAGASGAERFGIASLGEVRFAFCVAPHHPLASIRAPIEDIQIERHRAVVVADTARALTARTSGVLPGQPTLTVSSFQLKLEAHLAGLGCGYLPWNFAHPHVAAGRLVSLRLISPKPPASLRYAWRKVGRVRTRLLASPAHIGSGLPT